MGFTPLERVPHLTGGRDFIGMCHCFSYEKMNLLKKSGPHKFEEWPVFVPVGSPERFDVDPAAVAGVNKIATSPAESGALQNLNQQEVRNRPGMAPVAIWEGVYENQPVVKACGYLIG